MRARDVLRLAFIENPLVRRQLSTTLGPFRFGVIFAFVAAVLIVVNSAVFWAGFVESSLLESLGSSGDLLLVVNCAALYGLLSFLVPLRVAGVIDGPRHDQVLDQLVVTGVSPLRLICGGWVLGWLYSLVLLAISLPFVSFAMLLGGVAVREVVAAFGILALYSHVIIAVTFALATVEREWLTVPLAIALFVLAGIGAPFGIPALFEVTPLRAVFRALDHDLAIASWLGPADPVLFFTTVPSRWYAASLWAVIVLVSMGRLALGPPHQFAPGVNNFGQVVLRGDRRRRWRRRLRLSLSRRVDLRFFWENRPAWCDRWEGVLRLACPLLFVVFVCALVVGLFFRGAPQIEDLRFANDERMVLSIVAIAAVALVGICLRGDTRQTLGQRERLLGLVVPRPLVTAIIGIALIGLSFLVDHAVFRRAMDAAQAQALAEVPQDGATFAEFRTGWWRFAGGVTFFLFNAFLLGQVLSHLCREKAVWFVLFVVCGIVAVSFPPALLEAIAGGVVPPAAAPFAFYSPAGLIAAASPYVEREVLLPAGLAAADAFEFLVIGQCVTAVVLTLSLAGLWALRGRDARDRRGVLERAARGAVFLTVCAAVRGGARASAQEPPLPAGVGIADVGVGFSGVCLDSAPFFCTVTLQNELDEAVTGRLSLAQTGATDLEVEIAPRTTKLIRWVPAARDLDAVWFSGELELRFVTPGRAPSARTIAASATVVGDRAGARSAGQGVYLFVHAAGDPPFRGSWIRHEWLRARPQDLPEDQRAYTGLSGIVLHEVELAALSGLQRRALHDYLRLGGVVLVAGRVSPGLVRGASEWEVLLADQDGNVLSSRSVSRDGVSTEVIDLPESDVHSWLPGADERPATPVVQSRAVGAGRFGHVAVDLAARQFPLGSPERFWQAFSAALPRGCYPLLVESSYDAGSDELLDVVPLFLLLVYYIVYALALVLPLLLVFRRKSRRPRAMAYVASVVLFFTAALPLGRSFFVGRPSYASLGHVHVYGSGARRGVSLSVLRVRSSGRQDHRVGIEGRFVSCLDLINPRGSYRWLWQRDIWALFVPRASGAPAGVEEAMQDTMTLRPWATRQAVYIADVERETPHVGRALYDRQRQRLQFHVAGIEAPLPDAHPFLLLCDVPQIPGVTAVMALTSDPLTTSARGALSGDLDLQQSSRGVWQRLPTLSTWRLRAFFPVEAEFRVFVGWEVPAPPGAPVITAEEIRFEKAVATERGPAGEPVLKSYHRDPWRYALRGNTLYRRLECTIVLLELDVEVK